jgi:hypothetical protein
MDETNDTVQISAIKFMVARLNEALTTAAKHDLYLTLTLNTKPSYRGGPVVADVVVTGAMHDYNRPLIEVPM